MTRMVDKHSATWKAVISFLNKEHSEAIECLIFDKHSERQRGKIDLIARLKLLTDPQTPEVVYNDDYK